MVKILPSCGLQSGANVPPSQLVRCLILFTVVAANVFALPVARGDVESYMPDFYSEPDVGAFREGDATGGTETIDPLSGNLSIKYTDLSIPGNGGLDINITRTYTSSILYSRKTSFNSPPYPGPLLPTGPNGVGWTMNFGRIVDGHDIGFGLCDTRDDVFDDDTRENPVLELPGGRQQMLVSHNIGESNRYTFITKEYWGANCITPDKGLLVYSPEGTKYTFDHHVASSEERYSARLVHTYYPTRIEDANGNSLTFTYFTERKGSHALMKEINASVNRPDFAGDSSI